MTPLQIKTKYKDEGEETVSPTGQLLNCKTLSITILVILEAEIPIDDSIPIKDLLRDVLLPINPRFSSIMVPNKNGVQHWKKIQVNFEEHIKIPIFPHNLSLEAYTHHFNDYLTKIAMEELPQDKPLWEVHITKYPTTNAAGHCIFKLHHAIGDGYSLMSVLLSCFRRTDNGSLPLSFPSLGRSRRLRDDDSTWLGYFCNVYNTMCDFGWSVFKSVVGDDVTPIRSGSRSIGAVEISVASFSMESIKTIKTKLGVAGAQFMHDTIYNTSIGLTNMIGPVQKMALANHPCKGIYFTAIGPPHSLVVTMMSYMDTMRITIAVEKDFIDAQKLISCMVNAFNMIYNDVVEKAQG